MSFDTITKIKDIKPMDKHLTVEGEIIEKKPVQMGEWKNILVTLKDETGQIDLLVYKNYLKKLETKLPGQWIKVVNCLVKEIEGKNRLIFHREDQEVIQTSGPVKPKEDRIAMTKEPTKARTISMEFIMKFEVTSVNQIKEIIESLQEKGINGSLETPRITDCQK